MTVYPAKLHAELLDASLPVISVRSCVTPSTVATDLIWSTTPTSGQLTDAATIVTNHDPVNQVEEDAELSDEDLVTKAQTRITFFEGIVNTAWDTLSTADQNLAMKRLIQHQIFFLQQFMATHEFYADPP